VSVQVERRRHPRLAIARRVIVSPSEQRGPGVVCELHDVGAGGLRCASPSARLDAAGREVVVELKVPSFWGHRKLRLPARLIRSGPEPGMYAFEITAAAGSREARQFELFLRRASTASHRALEDRAGIDRQIEEALRMVQLGLPRHDEARPRVVMLTSPTPGATGFLAAGLAVVLEGQGDRALVVDLDFRDPVLHRLLGVRQSPGVVDWLRGGAVDRELLSVAQAGLSGVRVVPAGEADQQRLSCGRAAMASLVEGLRPADARYVIVNAPSCLITADAGLLSEVADDVLLVLRSEATTEAEVVEAGALLTRHGAQVRGVILTDAPSMPDWTSRVSAFLGQVKSRSLADRPAGRDEAASEPGSPIARQVRFPDAVAGGELGGDDRR
jgi:Mrp family chromosome partitioning ATPase